MISHVSGARSSILRPGAVVVALMLLILSPLAAAAQCGQDGSGFETWLVQFKQRAASQGITPATISSAMAGITYDPTVVRLDR